MERIFTKRKYFRGIIIIIIFFIIGFGAYQILWGTGASLNKHSRELTWYGIDAVFSPQERKLDCKQRVNYINVEDVHITDIYFHIYPNAFKYQDKAVFPPEEMDRAYPNGFSSGSIDFKNILIDGNPSLFTIEGYSDDILMISLEAPLLPGEGIDLWMEYSINLPNSPGRFGYYENTFNFGNWYPILCVYDEKGWNLEPYYSVGDPFYSDVSNYKVSITAPQDFVIASTGESLNIKKQGQLNTWELEALAVRDFAWVGSGEFKVSSIKVEDTTVYSYHYTHGGGEKALDYAASALKIFNKLFGKYPYDNLSVVQTDFFIGGMEYPRLVMVDGSLYGGEQDNWLELVTVHEVAHQWWYGLVGNDQIHDSWLDEALTEYSTILYYGERYGEEEEYHKYQELIAKGKYQLFKIYRAGRDTDETIHRPLYQFDDWVEYDSLVYGKGAMMFHEMRQSMGDEIFFKVLAGYLEDNRFKNARPEDLLKACEDITNKSWEGFFEEWLYDR